MSVQTALLLNTAILVRLALIITKKPSLSITLLILWSEKPSFNLTWLNLITQCCCLNLSLKAPLLGTRPNLINLCPLQLFVEPINKVDHVTRRLLSPEHIHMVDPLEHLVVDSLLLSTIPLLTSLETRNVDCSVTVSLHKTWLGGKRPPLQVVGLVAAGGLLPPRCQGRWERSGRIDHPFCCVYLTAVDTEDFNLGRGKPSKQTLCILDHHGHVVLFVSVKKFSDVSPSEVLLLRLNQHLIIRPESLLRHQPGKTWVRPLPKQVLRVQEPRVEVVSDDKNFESPRSASPYTSNRDQGPYMLLLPGRSLLL